MKQRTALKQSIVSVKVLGCAVVVMAVLSVRYPSGYTIVPLVVFGLFFAGDAYNIHRIRRDAAADASSLDKRIN